MYVCNIKCYIIIYNFHFFFTKLKQKMLTSLPGNPGIPLAPVGPGGPVAPPSPVSPRDPLKKMNCIFNNQTFIYKIHSK